MAPRRPQHFGVISGIVRGVKKALQACNIRVLTGYYLTGTMPACDSWLRGVTVVPAFEVTPAVRRRAYSPQIGNWGDEFRQAVTKDRQAGAMWRPRGALATLGQPLTHRCKTPSRGGRVSPGAVNLDYRPALATLGLGTRALQTLGVKGARSPKALQAPHFLRFG
jgi:hypothetical protein